jgi:uncharacterized protein (TIGR00304 family)
VARVNSSNPLLIPMEDETLIGSTLILVGFFIIIVGFFMIVASIGMSSFQNSHSGQGYSGRTGSNSSKEETNSSKEGTNYSETRDYSSSPYEKSPTGKAESKVKTGGVIMLGPIPIIFGSNNESAKTAAILAIILMLLSFLLLRGWLF